MKSLRQNVRKASQMAAAAAVLASLSAVSTEANAAFFIAICDDAVCSGTVNAFVQDNMAGDTNLTVGEVEADWLGLAPFAPNFTTLLSSVGLSKPASGSATEPVLDLSIEAKGTGQVWFFAGDTDFVGGTPAYSSVVFSGNQGSGNTTTASVYGGNNNTLPSFGNLIFTSGPMAAPAFALVTGAGFNTVNPYSLTVSIGIDNTNGNIRTTSGARAEVPEPATLALLGMGLVGVGLARRRKQI